MTRKPTVAALVALVAAIAVVGCGGVDGDPGDEDESGQMEESQPEYSAQDPEYMLAVFDADEGVELDDPLLDRYRLALDEMERVCPDEDREMTSDQAVMSTQLLEDEGIEITALEMLEGAQRVREAREAGVECSEVFGAVVALMTGRED